MRVMVLLAVAALLAAPGAIAIDTGSDDSGSADGGSCVSKSGTGVRVDTGKCAKPAGNLIGNLISTS